ncbi:MAG TPA: DedA family protein [Acidimicrobiales bacterium]|jgi:membrane protein DedA with SNARE-associated domain|nr:DedA family protein [Acidimicrobiales bacterium]
MLNASIVSFLTEKLHSVSPVIVYVLVALLVFGEAALFIGFVLPGETSVIVAGVVASQGRVNVVTVAILVVVAAIVGDSLGFEIGKRYGHRLIELPILRKRHDALERALEGLRRRGATYVFVGRFTAFLRAVMPGLAGMSRLPYRRFLAANAAGALLWGVGYTLLGYFAGHALGTIQKWSGWAGIAVLVLVVGLVVGLHYLKKRREAHEEQEWSEEHPGGESAKGAE